MEGNTDFKDGNNKVLYGHLEELLPVFEHIFTYFEGLEVQVHTGDFNSYPDITRSINYTWIKAKDYYGKTDQSVTWIALTIINPRFKMKYFEDK